MLENKIEQVAEVSNPIVYGGGWVSEAGEGIQIEKLLYVNNTGRMLMWSFESVSQQHQTPTTYLYPKLKCPIGRVNTASYAYTINRAFNLTDGVGERVNTGTFSNLGVYRFHTCNTHATGGSGKYMMLPPANSIYLIKADNMTSTYVLSYKLTVLEEDTSLLSIYP